MIPLRWFPQVRHRYAHLQRAKPPLPSSKKGGLGSGWGSHRQLDQGRSHAGDQTMPALPPPHYQLFLDLSLAPPASF